MIEVKNVSFSYGKTPAVKDVTLDLLPGRFYAIVGPNGSGKTTLLKLLARLSQPQTGLLTLDGKPYPDHGRKEFARLLALLPQGRNVPNMRVYDLVACARFPYLDLSRNLAETDHAAVRSALQATNTEVFAGKHLKTLSGGQRQRVYMAMLRAQETPYVLLDEPTTHLDIAAKLQTIQLLREMTGSGKCVAAVLHELDLALKYADEIIVMDQGTVLSQAGPIETAASGILETAFGIRCRSLALDSGVEYLFEPLL